MTVRSAYSALTNNIDRVTSAAARLGMDLAGAAGTGAPWHSRLRPASFRGVPFGVIASDAQFGRRVAVHEYPYRDSVWVEDLGRGPRRYSLTGFLVEDSRVYGGGPVLTQRDRLQRAVEAAGEGELVHPSLGRKSVALLRFREVQRHEGGRVIEIAFQFVEAGRLLYPGSATDTAKAVKDAADKLGLAAAADFIKKVGALIQRGAAIIRQVVGTVSFYVRMVLRFVDDATNLYNAVRDLPGSFGRFLKAFGSGRSGTTLTALKASTASNRAAVSKAGDAAVTAAAAATVGTVSDTAAAVQAHVLAASAAIATPVDRMRLLQSVATAADRSSPASVAVAALYRRAAIAEMARAAADYTPTSHDDAVTTRDRLASVIDAEILRAGDEGADATYSALRSLRAAVVADLTERGANLSRLVLVTSAAPTPSLVMAQRLYQDAARADELVDRAQPIHPAFMPTAFEALAE